MSDSVKSFCFFDKVQTVTENFLSRRKKRRRIKKEKRKKKHPVFEWVEAFLWAAGMVLLINQYLIQAYRIPSGSMIDTLNIGDHVFVNKLVYGPELLPGIMKIPSPIRPQRNDIIIFENPDYISRGPLFDIAKRVIHMITFSLVDIDRDERGDPRVHFLIKRAVGGAGDRIVTRNGETKILFSGEDRWVNERDYIRERGWGHNITHLLEERDFRAIESMGRAWAFADMQLPIPESLLSSAEHTGFLQGFDFITRDLARLETLRMMNPNDRRYSELWSRLNLGRYVPEGRVLPLGDNRDNSRDGRDFGPVRSANVLGRGMVVYWPFRRIGKIN